MSEAAAADHFVHGTVHEARADLQAAIRSDPHLLALWEGLTPLSRNEFICWVDDAKQAATRWRRIARTQEELLEGKEAPMLLGGMHPPHRQGAGPMAAGSPDQCEQGGAVWLSLPAAAPPE